MSAYGQTRLVGRCISDGCGHREQDHDATGTCRATIPLITGPRACVCGGYARRASELDPPARQED